MRYGMAVLALLLCCIVQAMPAMLEGLAINQGGRVRADIGKLRLKPYAPGILRIKLAMRIRGGGFEAAQAVSSPDIAEYNAYADLLAGDVSQLNHLNEGEAGVTLDPKQLERLQKKNKQMEEKVRLTKMFLILQNARIER
jgi:hypothetical protein